MGTPSSMPKFVSVMQIATPPTGAVGEFSVHVRSVGPGVPSWSSIASCFPHWERIFAHHLL